MTKSADVAHLYDAPGGLRPNQGHFFFLRPLPAVLGHRIAILVTEPAPFTLELPEPHVAAGLGATMALPVVCRRSGGFKGPVALRIEGLPQKVAVEAPPIAEGAERSAVQLKIANDAPQGQYLLALVGEVTVEGRKVANATPTFTLEVKPAGGTGTDKK